MRVSTLIRVAAYGGSVVLAASVWAWAFGFAAWHGAIAGVALGVGAGIFMDGMMRDIRKSGEMSSLLAPVMGLAYVVLLLGLIIVGAIVGIVRLAL